MRLVTLTGPGGTGKTRLALEVAAELVSDYDDGVFWVPLAGVSDPDLVLSTVAGVVGARRELAEHLRHRQILLALDNFEQVVAAAPSVSEFLSTCAGLRVLVTSREPLHIRGEHEFPVPVLDEQEAISLFRERAKAVRPGFAANGEVAAICERLERLPLAIELAAARIKVLEPAEMLTRLERRLPFLISRRRDVSERQRTLRNTIEWSYGLLDANEQRLFRDFSVFAGGAGLDAATPVCKTTLEGLESLVDKSLLRYDGGRFLMLETIREYALEQVVESETYELSRRHAAHFLELAEAARTMGEAGFARLESDHDNLRAALAWLSAAGAADCELRLAVLLSAFWTRRGHYREGRAWLEDALSSGEEEPTEQRMWALTEAAHLAFRQGDYARAEVLAKETLDVAHVIDSEKGVVLALNNLANLASAKRDYGRAASLYAEATACARASGNERDLALSKSNAATVAWKLGQFDQARALASEGLQLSRRLGEQSLIPGPHLTLGLVALDEGRHAEATSRLAESLRGYQELRDRVGVARALDGLAALAALAADHNRAARLASAADRIRSELGVPPSPTMGDLRAQTAKLLMDHLSPDDLAASQREGAGLTYDEVSAYALEEGTSVFGSETG